MHLPDAFLQLAEDHTRGATAVTCDIYAYLRETLAQLEDAAFAGAAGGVRESLALAARVRPSFATPQWLGAAARSILDVTPDGERRARLLALLDAERAHLERAPAAIARHAVFLLPARGTVATISAGETVKRTVLDAYAAGRRPRLVVGESRPLREGVALARDLARAGVDVTVVADAALPGLLDERTTVLLGTDRLAEDVFVGKIGCFPLALAAARLHRPCIALADTRKIVPRSLAPIADELFDPEELATASEGVPARNAYFETVPLRLISRIVTERGIWSRGDVRRQALRLPKRLRRGAALTV
jgi:translation initiation factor 2B subunit (eIF-2B alpha/beta/delta family)